MVVQEYKQYVTISLIPQMDSTTSSSSSSSSSKEVASELQPFLQVYKDGTVERFLSHPYVPPSLNDPKTSVSSKEIIISTNPQISARLFLPQITPPSHQKLPILLYFPGGGFCMGSAFSIVNQTYLNALVSRANIIAVLIEYRLAPEHPLPIAYEDSWAALQWVCSQSIKDKVNCELWLTNHGNFDKLFIGGDGAGANIAHNVAMRAGVESLNGGIKIHGAFLAHPYFWGSVPIGSESVVEREENLWCRIWKLVYPGSDIDDPMMNPMGPGAPSLGGLGCCKMLVCVAGKDSLRDRGVGYFNAVRESGWKGEVELFEVEGEGHAFHIFKPQTETAETMIQCLASFLI